MCGLWRLGACWGVLVLWLLGGCRTGASGRVQKWAGRGVQEGVLGGCIGVLRSGEYGSSQTVLAARLMHPSCTHTPAHTCQLPWVRFGGVTCALALLVGSTQRVYLLQLCVLVMMSPSSGSCCEEHAVPLGAVCSLCCVSLCLVLRCSLVCVCTQPWLVLVSLWCLWLVLGWA